jgi:starch synthase
MPRPPRVLMISSELESFARTGGLGDAVEALSRALAELGADVVVVSPLYGVTKVPANAAWWDAPVPARVGWGPGDEHPLGVLEVPFGIKHPAGRMRVCLLASSELYGNRNGIYGDAFGTFGDNALRFAAMSRGALSVADRAWGQHQGPDVIHAHDWHASFAILYSKLVMGDAWRARSSVFTIHNLAFQGELGEDQLDVLGLPREAWRAGWIKTGHDVNLMKGAIELADRVTTVSETYAREILEPENGYGLDAHLRWHAQKLVGITNGIDTDAFDPSTDPALARRYDARDARDGKLACKLALLRECGFDADADAPLFASVSRLAWQKGIDLALDIVPALVERGAVLLFVGQGEALLERGLRDLEARYPGRVVARIDFNPQLARRVFAGSDFLMVPSRYEPCGLTQMYAMRYGSIPIVTPVGGLVDTVSPLDTKRGTGTGIVSTSVDSRSLLDACELGLVAYRDSAAFASLVARAMRRESGWATSARQYMALYESLTPDRR